MAYMKHKILMLLSVVLFSIAVAAQENIPFVECHYAEKFRDNLLKKTNIAKMKWCCASAKLPPSFSVYGEEVAMKFKTAYWPGVEVEKMFWLHEKRLYTH